MMSKTTVLTESSLDNIPFWWSN